ncbi:MAG: uroporphyrinogen-III C-methyltransferase [Burkholderiaceae bacterium]|nr:uroporphyrinogen-III C-methyltransferase [Burkholderiaceae bacterium]
MTEPEQGLNPAARHPPAGAAEPPAATRSRRPALRGLVAWLALLIAVAVAAVTWPRLSALQSEAARRLQSLDQRQVQLEAALGQAQDELRDTRDRTAVLESKVLEAAGLQAQIEKLYRHLADDSVDVVLAEIESSLTLAQQQLALGSNPQASLRALQEIDARLVRQDDPSLAGVRRALADDIERLKAWPFADIAGMARRIDALSSSIDQFGLLASLRPPTAPAPASAATRAGAPAGGSHSGAQPRGGSERVGKVATRAGDAASRAGDAAAAGLSALRDQLQQLFRVRRIDAPDAALLAPEQAYFLRENLRLLLLNARLSLLSRNDALFRSDLGHAIAWLRKYYDPEQRQVANARAQLDQMLGVRITLEAPTLAATLAAVRAARSARDVAR